MGKLVVILNPHAKQNRKDPERAARCAHIIDGFGDVFETTSTKELQDTCRSLPDQDIEVVGICGGDGTNHLVMTALIKEYQARGKAVPRLLFLRGGSMNTICKNLGISYKAEDSLKALVSRHRGPLSHATFRQPTIEINGKFGSLFGAGYGYNFLKEYYSSGMNPGPMRAFKVVVNAAGSVAVGGKMAKRFAEKFQADVTVDGRRVDFDRFGMILAGTMEQIGVGFRPLYRAREKEGRFHVVATGFSGTQVLNQLHRFYAGKPMIGANHVDEVVSEVVIKGREPIGYFVDGELYDNENEITIKMGPTIEAILQA